MNLLKKEYQFSRYDYQEELVEKIQEGNIEGARTEGIYIEAEKTISNKSVNFKFDVVDEDMILSISYVGYYE